MIFHYQTNGVGIFRQRVHGERGSSVTNGMSDFRGVTEGGTGLAPDRPLGGIVEFGTSSEPIGTAKSALLALDVAANTGSTIGLKDLLVESPFHAHIAVMIVQAEDAPQPTNRVDLDPTVRDVFGLPVVRLTYRNHAFELDAAAHYKPLLIDIMRRAGAHLRLRRSELRRPAAARATCSAACAWAPTRRIGVRSRSASCTTSTTSTAWTAASCRAARATTRPSR